MVTWDSTHPGAFAEFTGSGKGAPFYRLVELAGTRYQIVGQGKNDLKEFADLLMHPEALYGIVSFMDGREESADKAILEKLADSEWMNLFWLDEIKESFLDPPEEKVDEIYLQRLKEKVDTLSAKVLKNILNEQNNVTSGEQNSFLQNLIKKNWGGTRWQKNIKAKYILKSGLLVMEKMNTS
jgi:hypothetical protein